MRLPPLKSRLTPLNAAAASIKRLPPLKSRLTPLNAAAASSVRLPPLISRLSPLNAAAATRSLSPISPRPLSPKGKRERGASGSPLRRGRGLPDWEIWVSPVSHHYNGRSSPDFPRFESLMNFLRRENRLTARGIDFARFSPDATGESQKTT